MPPKVHDLDALAEKAALPDVNMRQRLRALTEYYIATRYPEDRKTLAQRTDGKMAQSLVDTAKEVLAWATQQLTSTPSSPITSEN